MVKTRETEVSRFIDHTTFQDYLDNLWLLRDKIVEDDPFARGMRAFANIAIYEAEKRLK